MNVRNNIENLPQSNQTNAALQSPAVAKPTVPTGGNQAFAHTTGKEAVQDQAHVSNAATAVAKSSASSDVRLDKVAAIQSQIQAGTYHIPASAVAKKLISSLLDESK